MSDAIVRPVEILSGFATIGTALGHSADTAREWEASGAPIVRDGRGIPRAEKAELWIWYKLKFSVNPSRPHPDPTHNPPPA